MQTFEEIINAQEKNEVLDISGAFGDIETCHKLFNRFYVLYLKENYIWVDEHTNVIEWLKTNVVNGKNKGLLLSGGIGIGKTVIANNVVGEMLRKANYTTGNKLYDRVSLRFIRMQNVSSDRIDNMFYKNIIESKYNVYILDDVGTEQVGNNYGSKFEMFSNMVDELYNLKKLVIITTNLSLKDISERYGSRTIDRLVEMCKIVNFDKSIQSFRK